MSPDTVTPAFKRPLTWLVPVAAVSIIMSLLAALYLGGILDPRENLRHFPVALVVSDEGDVLPNGQQANIGEQIATGIVDGVDPEKIDLRRVGIADAQNMLANGEVYGAIVIPSDFTKRVGILTQASVVAGDIDKPMVTILTNQRAGTLGSSILTTIGDTALDTANGTLGEQLTAQVSGALPEGSTLSGAASLTLAQPIDIVVTPYDPLPGGTGLGLSSFYFALLLVLAGFTGATIANALIDSALGYVPLEVGARFRQRPRSTENRLATLAAKWLTMVVIAVVVSAIYIAIATALGMPVPHSLALWMYGTLAISAIGVTALSVMAVLGTPGLVVNLVVFVILGLPSAGATIPIEASPALFGWLAQFEPMHQVYLAVRSILYFDARWNSGLAHGLGMTVLGLVLGIAFGGIVMALYDRKNLERVPASEAR
jgi:YhgE/Pip-like protein